MINSLLSSLYATLVMFYTQVEAPSCDIRASVVDRTKLTTLATVDVPW